MKERKTNNRANALFHQLEKYGKIKFCDSKNPLQCGNCPFSDRCRVLPTLPNPLGEAIKNMLALEEK